MTTGASSSKDCYRPIAQFIIGFKAPRAMKFGAKTSLNLMTNSKELASFSTSGTCTAKLAGEVKTVHGKKVTTKILKLTAGKKTGICSINLTAPTTGKYLNLRQVVRIKVNKAGK